MAGSAIVLVEGESDRAAVLVLARRLEVSPVDVVATNGVHAFARHLRTRRSGVGVFGLCDAAEEGVVCAALAAAGIGAPVDRPSLEGLGFFVCVEDLEDELIRAAGPERVVEIVAANGDGRAFRTMQRQPEWRDRSIAAQLRRFFGAGSQRKIRYAGYLAEALEVSAVPRPLAGVLAAVGSAGHVDLGRDA